MCTGGSTGDMLRHLKSKHFMETPSSTQSDVSSNTQSASFTKRFTSVYSLATLHSFMNKRIRVEIVARLFAVYGFPPSAVCKSEFICQAFSDKGMLFQKNPNHVIQLENKQYEIAEDVVMMEIQQSLMSGKSFILSDEYSFFSSLMNFMNKSLPFH